MAKQKRTLKQGLKWWWTTRVMGFWRIKVLGAADRKRLSAAGGIEFNQDAKAMGAPSSGITVILTAYRRAEYLVDQIKALRAQTVPPEEIWVWSNRSEEDLLDVSELADRVIVSNTNWLFWGRFAQANLVRTEYVAFFDDDILPQPNWFKNCLDTIAKGFDGILGGSGVILPADKGYSSKHKAGWNGKHLSHTVPVDLVGHAWFMRKRHVQYMWREEPNSWDNGEDIHLSYMALKHGGIKTYVPPHPENDPSLWSCRPDFGKQVGRLKVATYKTTDHKDTRSMIVDAFRDDGWQVVCTHEPAELFEEKNFTAALDQFNAKLESAEAFSLVRFGDGEMIVIDGAPIDLSQKCNGEHKYTPQNAEDERCRQVLTDSLLYKNERYFVGLPCRCCVGDEHCDELRIKAEQADAQLTWANIFVNANYPRFMDSTVQILQKKPVIMVCHEKANVAKLPFAVQHSVRIGGNAWVKDYHRALTELESYIQENAVTNSVFIFCAGVLSNMLVYRLTDKFPQNTYLDVGSVFDDVMELGQTRKYLKGSARRLNKVCIW